MEFVQRVKCGLLAVSTTGLTRVTSVRIWARSGRSLLPVARTRKELFLRRCELQMIPIFGGYTESDGVIFGSGIESKQPNSAVRKCVRVQLIKNGKKIAAFVPNDGCLNFIDENDEVSSFFCKLVQALNHILAWPFAFLIRSSLPPGSRCRFRSQRSR